MKRVGLGVEWSSRMLNGALGERGAGSRRLRSAVQLRAIADQQRTSRVRRASPPTISRLEMRGVALAVEQRAVPLSDAVAVRTLTVGQGPCGHLTPRDVGRIALDNYRTMRFKPIGKLAEHHRLRQGTAGPQHCQRLPPPPSLTIHTSQLGNILQISSLHPIACIKSDSYNAAFNRPRTHYIEVSIPFRN